MRKPYIKLPSLTAGRGVAALFVAIHHACLTWGGVLSPLGNVGWLGVSYFYILSGFVLTWSFSCETSVKEFYVHRLARIYPLHILCLLLSLLAYLFIRQPLAGYTGTPIGTIANVLLVHDWIPGHPEIRQAWNGVSWSLSAEFFFYLCAPFLIRFSMRTPNKILIDIALGIFVAHLTIGVLSVHFKLNAIYDFLIYHPIARIPEFIYGIVAARIIQSGYRVKLIKVMQYGLFVPLILYVLEAANANAIVMIDFSVPAFLVLLMSGASADICNKSRPVFESLLQMVGEASFSLYMTHALLLGLMAGVVHYFHIVWHSSAFVVIFIVLSVVLSIVVYRLV